MTNSKVRQGDILGQMAFFSFLLYFPRESVRTAEGAYANSYISRTWILTTEVVDFMSTQVLEINWFKKCDDRRSNQISMLRQSVCPTEPTKTPRNESKGVFLSRYHF